MPQTKARIVTVAAIAAAAGGLLVWAAPMWQAHQARLRASIAARSCAMSELEWVRNYPAFVNAQRAYDKIAPVLSKYADGTTEHDALLLLRGKLARDFNEAAASLQVWIFGTEGCGDAWRSRRMFVEAALAKSGPEVSPTDEEIADNCAARAALDEPPDRDR